MYLEFFKFKKDPFDIAPDPDFLFRSPSHKEAFGSIFYGIEVKNGFVAVTGEYGVGKTTVLKSCAEKADPEKIRIVYIFNAALSFRALLKQICSELGVQAAGKSPAKLVDALFYYLIDENSNGRNVVLIIDDAQDMPVETLDQLPILSNLETSQDKLIQIILAGRPGLEAKLNLPELKQLRQRIAIQSRIEPLTPEESIAYINHRLMLASLFPNPVFTQKALKLIIRKAKGIPRTINILCRNALVTALGHQCKPVDEKIVKKVIRDFGRGEPRSGLNRKIIWVPAVVACFAATVFVSANIISRFETLQMRKQSIRAKLRYPLPAGVPPETARRLAKSPPAIFGTKLSGSGERSEKKVRVVTAFKPESGIAERPKTTLAVQGAKFSPVSSPEGKTVSAVVGAKPAAADASQAKSTPAALTAHAASGGESLSQKAPENLSAPAGPAAQADGSLALAPRLEGEPLLAVVVKKGDSVSKILIGVYGRVDEEMLSSFKKLNPQVKDINRIVVGKKIFLPQLAL